MSPRRVLVQYRQPKRDTIEGVEVEVHESDGRARLIVVKTNDLSVVDRICLSGAEGYEGLPVIHMSPGSEFEVWEEADGKK